MGSQSILRHLKLMRIKAKYSKLSLSESSSSSFSLSQENNIARCMRRKPKVWILGAVLTGIIFIALLIITLNNLTLRKDRINWLKEYYSARDRQYPIIPRDEGFNALLPRVKGVILILCRNSDREAMTQTLTIFEKRFNKKYRYPYVFLNNEEFDASFRESILKVTQEYSKAQVQFGIVPSEHWSYPSWIDQERAANTRKSMAAKGVAYGGSESYRFMCRYYSGFFYRHSLLQQYEYYWRLEPGVDFSCDINYDVFRFMKDRKKKYGFVISMQEIPETVPTLWKTIIEDFLPKGPQALLSLAHSKSPAIRYFGPPTPHGYNGCHFWSNFEIASFELFRSKDYEEYFKVLDRAGGFFYERWGDAPVHSIAAGLFLNKEEVHYFYDIGYHHHPFSHCPVDFMLRSENNCACDPFEPSDISNGVCQTLWNVHYAL